MPSPRLLFALFLSATMVAGALGAQSDSAPPTACSYDACALRQNGGAILRGMTGEKVANLGVFSATDLTSIVRGDSALTYARVFHREYGRGNRLLWGGLILGEGSLIVIRERMRDDAHFAAPETALVGVALGGFVISEVGGMYLRRARDAASKAIWWHNRDLPR